MLQENLENKNEMYLVKRTIKNSHMIEELTYNRFY